MFAVLFGAAVFAIELLRRGTLIPSPGTIVFMAIGLGLLNAVLVAIGVGPGVARLSRSQKHFSAAVIGALHGPVYIAVSWYLFSESNETLQDTLRFWARVPGELLIHLGPAVVAGLTFAVSLRRHPLKES